MKKNKAIAIGAGLLVALTSVSCTHNPITKEKAFTNFGECMAANVGGTAMMILVQRKIEEAINHKTGSQGQKNVNSVLIAMGATLLAWKECAAVYQKIEYSDEVPRDVVLKSGLPDVRKDAAAVKITEFSVKATRPGEPIQTNVQYLVLSADPSKKDIPVIERRSLDIFSPAAAPTATTATTATAINGNASSFQNMILVPKEVTAAQGSRRASGEIPTPGEMPADQLYRFGIEIEAEGLKASQQVEFRFDGKQYSMPVAMPVRQAEKEAKPQAVPASARTTETRKHVPAPKKRD